MGVVWGLYIENDESFECKRTVTDRTDLDAIVKSIKQTAEKNNKSVRVGWVDYSDKSEVKISVSEDELLIVKSFGD